MVWACVYVLLSAGCFHLDFLGFDQCCATDSIYVWLWFTQAGLHKLELNPYWKNGGTGLPPEEITGTAATKGRNPFES